ncbi:low molecular weight protein-tyrosine-phosphatase [Thalassotalea ponticola]|uniref:low molecular weight protein-tyrosine-phosphatase n=1 Tax=Thalassotalea ponticola TaxID=1523392 RepID=UPI0025B2BC92|nr:low molecular weight protein-tyrosine-phosphatase [Thalassotalea ponticola]MDN3652642.1 low molecular weight protein-tyrosine-phosphatase [Thalassotalea ponticola]
MFDNILTVCVGNICRSPVAERMLAKQLPNKTVSSAGIGALQEHGIEPHMVSLLEQHGYNGQNHSARQISHSMVNDADLILVMEKKHQQLLMQKYPAASGKIMLLGKWHNDEEVADPYKKSQEAFNHAFTLIDKHCQAWCSKIGN